MYFSSRLQAGRMLAAQLVPKYRYENCIVVALNDGGVMVGMQIAIQLHCIVTMLPTEEILLPREPVSIGGITADGSFVYNHEYTTGDIEEIESEYRNVLEQGKLEGIHKINQLIGSGGMTDKSLLKGHNVILVSDGMKTGFLLDMAIQFLKPVKIEKLIVATPLASVSVVDQMHIYADEICCLDVPAEYVDTDHYYEKHDVPDHKAAVAAIEQIILKWK